MADTRVPDAKIEELLGEFQTAELRSILVELRERRAATSESLKVLKLAESHFRSSENCGVCHPVGDCPTLRAIQTEIRRAEPIGTHAQKEGQTK